jgi:hypothetical protein
MPQNNHTDPMDSKLLLKNASDLIKRQSVRATFRLSAEFIEALSLLATRLGIKQKSLFDHLLEDAESLQTIAENAQPETLEKKNRVQKTFVISRKSLSALNAVSKECAASRDDLVEYSIQRLLPILLTERRKQENREAALSKIFANFTRFNKLLHEVDAMVGKEDPMYQSLEAVLDLYQHTCREMECLVEKGKRIADLPLEKFRR